MTKNKGIKLSGLFLLIMLVMLTLPIFGVTVNAEPTEGETVLNVEKIDDQIHFYKDGYVIGSGSQEDTFYPNDGNEYVLTGKGSYEIYFYSTAFNSATETDTVYNIIFRDLTLITGKYSTGIALKDKTTVNLSVEGENYIAGGPYPAFASTESYYASRLNIAAVNGSMVLTRQNDDRVYNWPWYAFSDNITVSAPDELLYDYTVSVEGSNTFSWHTTEGAVTISGSHVEGSHAFSPITGKCPCGTVYIDERAFPDASFLGWIDNNVLGADDKMLTAEELSAVTDISLSSLEVASLRGIEHFDGLTHLICASPLRDLLPVGYAFYNASGGYITLEEGQTEISEEFKADVCGHQNRYTFIDESKHRAVCDICSFEETAKCVFNEYCSQYCKLCGNMSRPEPELSHSYGYTPLSSGTEHIARCYYCREELREACSYEFPCSDNCKRCYNENPGSVHTEKYVSEGDQTHGKVCEVCGKVIAENEAHSYTDSICTVCNYTCTHTGTSSEGICDYCGKQLPLSVTVNESTYFFNSFVAAFDKAGEGTAESVSLVKVLGDVALDETVRLDGVAKLDLNGFTVNCGENYIMNFGTFEICDSKGGGLLVGSKWYALSNQGNFTLTGGTVQNTSDDSFRSAIGNDSSSAYTVINGGKVIGVWSAIGNNGGTTVINGGSFIGELKAVENYASLTVNGGDLVGVNCISSFRGDVDITGGSFTGDVTFFDGTAEISGGTFASQTASHNCIDNYGAALTISGNAEIKALHESCRGVYNNGGTLNISGGSFTATGTDSIALYINSYDSVSISGGTFIGTLKTKVDSLSALLADGYLFYGESGNVIELSEGQTELSATVSVDECEHISLSYTAEGNVITETCNTERCPHTVTAVLNAPENAVYQGENNKASVEYADGWLGGELSVAYGGTANDGTAYTDIPVKAGEALASITVQGATASINYTVLRAENEWTQSPSIVSWMYGTYDSEFNAPIASARSGEEVKFFYRKAGESNWNSSAPTEAGSYELRALVEESHDLQLLEAIIEFTVGKTYLSEDLFVLSYPENLNVCDGLAKEVSVSVREGIAGVGSISVIYCNYDDGTPLESAPRTVGTYCVKITVSEGSNYLNSEGYITDAAWKFTFDITDEAEHTGVALVPNNNCTHDRTCTLCEKIFESGTLCSGTTTDDCDKGYKCSCGGYFGTKEHSIGEKYLSDADGHYRKCTDCPKTYEKLAHTPKEDDGSCLTEVVCSACGFVTTKAYNIHDFSGENLYDTEGHWHKCERCNAVTAKHEHSFTVPEKDKTHHWNKCSDCEAADTKTAHSGTDDGDCTTAVICSCGNTVTEAKADHTGGTACCTAKAECSVCAKEYGELDRDTHSKDGFIYTEAPDGSSHTKKYECCNAIAIEAEAHSYLTDGKCVCGKEMPIPTYTVTVENGKLNGEDKTEMTVNENGTVTVKANAAAEGKVFKGWLSGGEIVSTDESYTFTVAGNISLEALYADASEDDSKGGPSAVVTVVIAICSAAALAGGGFAVWYFVFKKKKA